MSIFFRQSAPFASETGTRDSRVVYIKNYVCDAMIGIYQQEMERSQKISIDLAVQVELPQQPIADDFANVLDYAMLRDAMRRIIAGGHIGLQETLGEAIADYCLGLKHVLAVYVRVGKLEAFEDCERVGFELIRYSEPARRTQQPKPPSGSDAAAST